MNLYPSIRFTMGDWTYYVVKMTFREVSDSVKFASQVYEDRTLDEAIQRVLNDRRVQKEIVSYVKRQPYRFFSSIVVAALEGDPTFYPVEITDDPRFTVFRDDKRLNDTFGVLRFDGEQNYYALDGQHRLAAIKTVLDPNSELSEGAPASLPHDEISVIVVVPKPGESNESFMQRYRRLFSNLNRYAKPMDQATNIIMDEDDAFAILTRRLITEHKFFMSPGRQRESRKIKTERGKNLRTTDPFFTSIETLYDMNRTLLASRERQNHGWTADTDVEKLEDFVRFRPDEDVLDRLYTELVVYWDAILEEIPALSEDPTTTMRVHSLRDNELEGESHDHLLFWPIGQDMLASVVRDLLDDRLVDPQVPDLHSARQAISGLGAIDWELHRPPWRYFFLTQDENGAWKLRNEERAVVIRLGRRIVMWLMGEELDSEQLGDLEQQWAIRLLPNQDRDAEIRMWEKVQAQRRP